MFEILYNKSHIMMMPFFQPDWVGECWGRWAGTRAAVDWSKGSGSSGWAWTAAGLIYRLCVWLFSAKRTRKKKGRVTSRNVP